MIITVDQDIYDRLNRQLKQTPDKIPDVMRKTINSAASKGRRSVVKHTGKRYVLQDEVNRIKAATKSESAAKKYHQATITIKGKPEPLMNFHISPNGVDYPAKARVLATSEMEDLVLKGKDNKGKDLKAFVATMTNKSKTGNVTHHVGVFQRQPGKQMKSNPKKTAIKQLYSTSIPQMVKNEKVYAEIEADIKEEMRRVLDRHIRKVMEGM